MTPYSDNRLCVGWAGVGERSVDPFLTVSVGLNHGDETRGGSGSKVNTDIVGASFSHTRQHVRPAIRI